MQPERLEQFSAAWTSGDVDKLMSFMTDDCVYHASVGPDPGATYRGPAEVRRGFERMLAFDQQRERRSGQAVIVGDMGFAEWSFDETAPDGRRRTIRGCDIFRFRDDQIVEKDAYRKVLDASSAVAEATEPDGTEQTTPPGSAVTAAPAAGPDAAAGHFAAKLAYETDCADVWRAIESGTADFTLVDCRQAGNFTKTHLPGAISLPWQEITAGRVEALPDGLLVTYCWGPSCNAATKGARRLAALGRPVKEMIGGLEYWVREGHPTEGRRPVDPSSSKPSDWGLVA